MPESRKPRSARTTCGAPSSATEAVVDRAGRHPHHNPNQLPQGSPPLRHQLWPLPVPLLVSSWVRTISSQLFAPRSTDLPRGTPNQIHHLWALSNSPHRSLCHRLLYPRLPIYLVSLSSSAVLIFWMVCAMYKESHVKGDQDEVSEGPDPDVAFILSPSEQLHACLNQPNSVLVQFLSPQCSWTAINWLWPLPEVKPYEICMT